MLVVGVEIGCMPVPGRGGRGGIIIEPPAPNGGGCCCGRSGGYEGVAGPTEEVTGHGWSSKGEFHLNCCCCCCCRGGGGASVVGCCWSCCC